MADPANPKHLDKRTFERYQRSGQLSEEDYKKHIDELPDVSEKSVPVETRMADEFEEDLEDDTDDEDEDEDEGGEDEDEDNESAG
jgi:hypothetical protein